MPVDELTPQRLKELKELFNEIDEDGSGSIDTQELIKLMQRAGHKVDEAEAKDMIDQFDEDGSGEIEFIEFVDMMKQHEVEPVTEADLSELFKDLDTDGGGTICKTELSVFMRQLMDDEDEFNDDDVDALMGEVDEDGSGEMDFDEFRKLMSLILYVG